MGMIGWLDSQQCEPPTVLRLSYRLHGNAVPQLRVIDPLEFNRIVLKRHRVTIFKQRTHELVDARITAPASRETRVLAALREFRRPR